MTTTEGPTISDRIGEEITKAWRKRKTLFDTDLEARSFWQAEGRILGLAQALAIIRSAPNRPSAEQVKAISLEFAPDD